MDKMIKHCLQKFLANNGKEIPVTAYDDEIEDGVNGYCFGIEVCPGNSKYPFSVLFYDNFNIKRYNCYKNIIFRENNKDEQ